MKDLELLNKTFYPFKDLPVRTIAGLKRWGGNVSTSTTLAIPLEQTIVTPEVRFSLWHDEKDGSQIEPFSRNHGYHITSKDRDFISRERKISKIARNQGSRLRHGAYLDISLGLEQLIDNGIISMSDEEEKLWVDGSNAVTLDALRCRVLAGGKFESMGRNRKWSEDQDGRLLIDYHYATLDYNSFYPEECGPLPHQIPEDPVDDITLIFSSGGYEIGSGHSLQFSAQTPEQITHIQDIGVQFYIFKPNPSEAPVGAL